LALDGEGASGFTGHDPEVLGRVVERERTVLHELPSDGSVETEMARVLALCRLGEALLRLGRMRDAAQQFEQADHLITNFSGSGSGVARVRYMRVVALIASKQYDEVPALSDEVIRFGEEQQHPLYCMVGWHARAVALKALRCYDEASEAAAALIELLPAEPSIRELGFKRAALIVQAQAARVAGDHERGLVLISDALAIAVDGEDRKHLCEALRERAQLLYFAGRSEEAREACAEIVRLFSDSEDDFAKEAVAWARAMRIGIRIRPRRRARGGEN
jgi:tetratricopeptide (TPR) repeat protein